MKKTYEVSVGIDLAVKGNYPLVKHPNIGDWIGWQGVSRLVDESNQSLFTAPLDLEQGELSIINPSHDEDLIIINTKSDGQLELIVDYASISSITTDTDQTALMSLSTFLKVEAIDEEEAYNIVSNLVNNATIDEVTFRDNLEGKIYTAQVLNEKIEVWSEYIREAEEDECA